MALTVRLDISEQLACKKWALSGRVMLSDGSGAGFANVSVTGVLTGGGTTDDEGYFRFNLNAPETGDFVISATLGTEQGDTSDAVSNGIPSVNISYQLLIDTSDEFTYSGQFEVAGEFSDETPQCCEGEFGVTGGEKKDIVSSDGTYSGTFNVAGPWGGATSKTVEFNVQIVDPYGRVVQNWCQHTFMKPADSNHEGQG